MKNMSFTSSLKSVLSATASRLPLGKFASRFRDDEDGIAAIEFAIIAPIMIGMYFGLAEIASAISVDRRISHGTNVAGDLATQQPEIMGADIEEILAAAVRVMGVDDVNQVSMDIESFVIPAAGQPPQSQGRIRLNSSAGDLQPFDASVLDDRLLNVNSGVVVTRVRYNYTPLEFRFFDSTVKLQETFLLKPRRSDAVQIHNGPGSVVNCSASSFSTVSCSSSG
jgi:Flp pilus assembly protein TadG